MRLNITLSEFFIDLGWFNKNIFKTPYLSYDWLLNDSLDLGLKHRKHPVYIIHKFLEKRNAHLVLSFLSKDENWPYQLNQVAYNFLKENYLKFSLKNRKKLDEHEAKPTS